MAEPIKDEVKIEKMEAKPEGERLVKTGETGPKPAEFLNRFDGPPADATPKLNAALVEVVKSTPWVEFTKPEKGGGISYEYISEEDIVKALRKVLPEHGLTIMPRAMELVNKETYNSRSGGRMVNLLICVTYRLSHVSGEYIEGQAFGEGSDSGDKAANKAMTGAFKYFLRQVTLVAGGTDPDKTSSDDLARAAKNKGQGQQKGTGTATGSAPQAGGPKPTKTPEQRLADALAHVAKLNSHDDIKKAAKQAGEVFKANKALAAKVYTACSNRATILFTGAVGKADDLETVDAIIKQAEADRIGTENLTKLKAAAEKRQAAIAGDNGSPGNGNSGGDDDSGGNGSDDAEPLDF